MSEVPAAAVEAVASDEIMAELCGSIMAIRTEFGQLSDMQIAEIVWSRAYRLIRQATADEIEAEIRRYRRQLETESDLPEVKKSGRWLAQVLLKIGVVKVCEEIARRVGGGGGGGQ